jgi:pilus assembly protein Flp/PilA
MRRTFILLQNLVARSVCRDERGATAVEYALILIFIALVIIAGLTLIGTRLTTIFHNMATRF